MGKDIKEHNLTEGTVWKALICFALPIFFGTLFQAVYSIADAFILGRFAGKDALAAIESVHTLINLPVNFFTGLSTGAAVLISQLYGAGRLKALSDACHNAVAFSFAGGLLLSLAAAASVPFMTSAAGVPDNVISDARRYLVIYYAGMSVSMLYNMGAGILRALGNSKTPFYFLVTANIVNIILDSLFIIVFGMGAAGAAAATVAAQAVSAFLVMHRLTRTKSSCRIYIKRLKLHREHMRELLRLGLPVGIQSTLFPVSNTVVQTRINMLGVDSIAAWAISGKIDFLVWYVAEAFAATVSTFVAQNYGAGELRRAGKGIRILYVYSTRLIIPEEAYHE